MADEGRGKLAELEARLARVGSELRAALPERARELRAAAEQLSVDEASARVHIARLAHRLRGTAATYGAESLTDPAARLEAGAEADDVREVSSATIALAELAEQATRGAPPATASATDTSTPAQVPGVFVKPLAGVRILAIDDDEATRRLLTITLVNLGGAAAWVEHAAPPFFEKRRAEAFDIVIVDAMMPELDGRACLERIALMPLTHAATRYFVMSASSPSELAWTLPPELGVRWLRKPFRPRDLLRSLAERDAT